jgi:hypothetical protein
MTVAAAIEIGAERTSTPSQSKVLGTGIQEPLASTASGAASFRAGWQSLLASLGSSMEGYSSAEANQGNTTASTSTLAAGAKLRHEQGIEKGSSKTGAANLSAASAKAESISMRLTVETTNTATTKTAEKKSATKPESESVHTKTANSSGTAAEPATDLLSALPQSVPVAGISNTVAPVLGLETQAERSELSTSLTTGFTSASLNSHQPSANHSGELSVVANTAAGETAKESEKPAKQGQASLDSSMNQSSGAAVGTTTSLNAKEDAPSPAALRSQDETALETQTPERIPTPALATSQPPTQTLVASQSSIQTLSQGQSEISTPLESSDLKAAFASTDQDGLNLSPVPTSAAAQPGKLSAVAPSVSKSGSASGKASTCELSRSARGTSNSDLIEHGSRLIDGQSTSSAVDATTMARELADARGAASMAGEMATTSTAAKTGPDSRETFATLDAEAASGNPTWIHTSAQRAEAGYNDPILGWVGVRADAGGSGVHAEVVAGSADAAQALGSHMAGLNAYLAEHHTAVETLTLTSSESGWTGMGSDKGAGDGMQQGTGQQTGQETAQGTYAGFQSRPSHDSSVQSQTALPELPAITGGLNGNTQTAGQGNIHISVMA